MGRRLSGGNFVEAVTTTARGLQVPATEVALGRLGLAGRRHPIVGALTTAQLRTALASEHLELPAELVEALDGVSA